MAIYIQPATTPGRLCQNVLRLLQQHNRPCMATGYAIDSRTGRTPLQVWPVLAAAVVAASLASIFIRLALEQQVPPLVIAAARLCIAALVLTPVTLVRHHAGLRRLTRRDLLLICLAGLALALHFSAWILSLDMTAVLISVVFVSTYPLWIALLERLFLGLRPARLVLAGLLLTVIGGAAIGLAGQGPAQAAANGALPGAMLALLGSLAAAVYLVIGRSLRPRLALLPYIWLVYGIAGLATLSLLLIQRAPLVSLQGAGLGWTLAVALIPQLIGHSGFNYALGYLSATPGRHRRPAGTRGQRICGVVALG